MTDELSETPEQECQYYLSRVKECIATLLGCSSDEASNFIGFLVEGTDGGKDVKHYSHEVPMYWAIQCVGLFIRLREWQFFDDVSTAMGKYKTHVGQPFCVDLIQDIRKIIEDHGGMRDSDATQMPNQ